MKTQFCGLLALLLLTGCVDEQRPENLETRGRPEYKTVNGTTVEEWVDGHGRRCTRTVQALDCDFPDANRSE